MIREFTIDEVAPIAHRIGQKDENRENFPFDIFQKDSRCRSFQGKGLHIALATLTYGRAGIGAETLYRSLAVMAT
jgi:hypothetical protein